MNGMPTTASALRDFRVVAPLSAVVVLLIFFLPINFDLWFSKKRRLEAGDVFRKLWKWVREGR